MSERPAALVVPTAVTPAIVNEKACVIIGGDVTYGLFYTAEEGEEIA